MLRQLICLCNEKLDTPRLTGCPGMFSQTALKQDNFKELNFHMYRKSQLIGEYEGMNYLGIVASRFR